MPQLDLPLSYMITVQAWLGILLTVSDSLAHCGVFRVLKEGKVRMVKEWKMAHHVFQYAFAVKIASLLVSLVKDNVCHN